MSAREEEEHGYEPIIKTLMKALTDIKGSLMDFLKPLTFDWNSSEYEDFQLFIKDMESWYTLQGIPDKAVVDLRGGMRDVYPAGGQILSNSCSFWENLAKLYVGTPLGSWCPLLGEILDPPLQGITSICSTSWVPSDEESTSSGTPLAQPLRNERRIRRVPSCLWRIP